jgi:hypothetical protein
MFEKEKILNMQTVQQQATAWTDEVSEFESWYGQDFSPPHIIHTSSEDHPPSAYPMGTGGWGDSGEGVKLTNHLSLVPRSRIRESIHPLPHISSWHSAKLVNHSNNFTFKMSRTKSLPNFS